MYLVTYSCSSVGESARAQAVSASKQNIIVGKNRDFLIAEERKREGVTVSHPFFFE